MKIFENKLKSSSLPQLTELNELKLFNKVYINLFDEIIQIKNYLENISVILNEKVPKLLSKKLDTVIPEPLKAIFNDIQSFMNNASTNINIYIYNRIEDSEHRFDKENTVIENRLQVAIENYLNTSINIDNTHYITDITTYFLQEHMYNLKKLSDSVGSIGDSIPDLSQILSQELLFFDDSEITRKSLIADIYNKANSIEMLNKIASLEDEINNIHKANLSKIIAIINEYPFKGLLDNITLLCSMNVGDHYQLKNEIKENMDLFEYKINFEAYNSLSSDTRSIVKKFVFNKIRKLKCNIHLIETIFDSTAELVKELASTDKISNTVLFREQLYNDIINMAKLIIAKQQAKKNGNLSILRKTINSIENNFEFQDISVSLSVRNRLTKRIRSFLRSLVEKTSNKKLFDTAIDEAANLLEKTVFILKDSEEELLKIFYFP